MKAVTNICRILTALPYLTLLMCVCEVGSVVVYLLWLRKGWFREIVYLPTSHSWFEGGHKLNLGLSDPKVHNATKLYTTLRGREDLPGKIGPWPLASESFEERIRNTDPHLALPPQLELTESEPLRV